MKKIMVFIISIIAFAYPSLANEDGSLSKGMKAHYQKSVDFLFKQVNGKNREPITSANMAIVAADCMIFGASHQPDEVLNKLFSKYLKESEIFLNWLEGNRTTEEIIEMRNNTSMLWRQASGPSIGFVQGSLMQLIRQLHFEKIYIRETAEGTKHFAFDDKRRKIRDEELYKLFRCGELLK